MDGLHACRPMNYYATEDPVVPAVQEHSRTRLFRQRKFFLRTQSRRGLQVIVINLQSRKEDSNEVILVL